MNDFEKKIEYLNNLHYLSKEGSIEASKRMPNIMSMIEKELFRSQEGQKSNQSIRLEVPSINSREHLENFIKNNKNTIKSVADRNEKEKYLSKEELEEDEEG